MENRQANQKKSKEIVSYIKTIAGAILLGVLITQVLVVSSYVPSASMQPTLNIGDRAFGSRVSYWFGSPQRGDIVVFWAPDNPDTQYVKRIIGLPGETIEITDNCLYVNGAVNTDFAELDSATQGNWGPYTVPEDQFFVMGDNRNQSLDSRFWANTFVSKKDILGKVIIRYWPSFALF